MAPPAIILPPKICSERLALKTAQNNSGIEPAPINLAAEVPDTSEIYIVSAS